MTRNIWSDAELEVTVVAYIELYKRFAAGEGINREAAYRELSQQHGRSRDAYQYRFRNISHVLNELGLPMLPGLAPQSHIGVHEPTIRRFIEQHGYYSGQAINAPTADPEQLEQRTRALRRRGVPTVPPTGSTRPPRATSTVERVVRDPNVKAWVLEQAAGSCENCGLPAPFMQEDGTPYLEVHHIKWLAQGGSDTVSNAVGICPNCHRAFHYGADAAQLAVNIIRKVGRLVAE
jgi:5-methylcytosine-specific restriction protein A